MNSWIMKSLVVGVLGLVLAGCGGGNDLPDDEGSGEKFVERGQKVDFILEDNHFYLQIPFVKKVRGADLILDDFSLKSIGCRLQKNTVNFKPSSLHIPSNMQQGSLEIIGRLTSSSCIPDSFTVDFHYKAIISNHEITGTDSVNYDVNKSLKHFGSVSTLSLTYDSSQCVDVDNGQGQKAAMKFIVHAVDKNGNPARGGVTLMPYLINGVKVAHRKSSAQLIPGDMAEFVDSNENFINADVDDQDRLIIVPTKTRNNKAYLGNWHIDVLENAQSLLLNESYNGNMVDNLAYVIGNEKRVINNNVVVADISRPGDEKDANYTTDDNGEMVFEVIYDYRLAARTVTLAVNAEDKDLNGNTRRIGIATIDSFRWPNGFESTTAKVINDGNEQNATLQLTIKSCSGDPVEFLSGIEIVPSSIIIDPGSQCSVNENKSNFTTDQNGRLHLVIDTEGNTTVASDCSVTWDTKGVYLEY